MERSSSIVSWCVQFLHHCTGLEKLPQNDPSHIKIGPQDQKLQSKYWNVVASKSNWWQPPNSIPTKGRLFFWPIEVIWTEKSWNNFFEGYQNFISPWSVYAVLACYGYQILWNMLHSIPINLCFSPYIVQHVNNVTWQALQAKSANVENIDVSRETRSFMLT